MFQKVTTCNIPQIFFILHYNLQLINFKADILEAYTISNKTFIEELEMHCNCGVKG